jgi:putative peptide zinc metalloprotease protein
MTAGIAAAAAFGASEAEPRLVEPPQRADGVELVGNLPGSGFEAQQFLVQRDGQFVQITELLFRLLEEVDGTRGVEELAARVTERSPWAVTPDDARGLLERKLLPLGLVASTGASAPSSRDISRSAFMVNAPIRLVGEATIESVTRITQWLFAPPAAVALLLLAAIAHLWLYVQHGIGNAILEVLYAPGLIVAAFVILAFAGLIHELGHASALRYGGGRARSIGAGIYLVYPAFFTDVTDSYRLPRVGRIRTDVGGVYFHLLVALALVALYQVTRWELLLFCAVLIDLEAIRQALPFVRMDGYWLLADLTGVPDPFSQMLPFLRTVAGGRLSGARLPTLRPWVRRAFLTYIALTIPVVVVLLVLLLARLPNLLGTLWDALLLQGAQIATAFRAADVGVAALSVLQVAILAFEIAATVFVFAKLVASGAGALGQWIGKDARRRTVGSGVVLAVAAGLGLLWAPHIPGLSAGTITGVQYFEETDRRHVEGRVDYAENPPVGGAHAPIWQNCGFYSGAVPPERAVHSMEHGAVWITYLPGTAESDLARLRDLASSRSHVLVSALPDNPAPIVASAWGRQLRVDRADDPRLEQFVRAFRLGSQAPESGGPCVDGAGDPG